MNDMGHDLQFLNNRNANFDYYHCTKCNHEFVKVNKVGLEFANHHGRFVSEDDMNTLWTSYVINYKYHNFNVKALTCDECIVKDIIK